ncbi:MAG: TetR/AcrR family transcriptional regulator [Oscillospiraceae bacterium]|nr:TetR/AcrR family transcriptional regulator [Oscillospiraceae bacterium]
MSDNPQFKRTDKAIMQALISLLNKKPFEKITIQDILDETPVTRATFYAHYRDKYEIAEKMLDHFLSTRDVVRRDLASPSAPSREVLYKAYLIEHEFTKALMKIHTEKVDFRKAVAGELEKEYLETSASTTRDLEAKIYAQAYVELYISLLNSDSMPLPTEQVYAIFIPVAAKLLGLENDRETLDFLQGKIAKKFSGK